MTVRQFVVVVLVFAAGFAMASIKSRKKTPAPEQLDFSEPVKVVLTSNPPDPRGVEYSTHRVVVDGQGRDLGTCPRDDRAEVWRVELAGGRVVLFTTRKQFE